MTAWAITITERDGTLVGAMDADDTAGDAPFTAANGQDALFDVAVGEITFPLAKATQNGWMVEDRFLHLYARDQLVTSYVVSVPEETLISLDAEQGETATYDLFHLNALLNEGIVAPARGFDSQPHGPDRIFDSSDPAYDDSGWDAVDVLGTVEDAQSEYTVTPYAVGSDNQGFPAPAGADVIGPPGYGWTDDAPTGRCYFRKDFTVTDSGLYGFWSNGDNAHESRIDGVTIIPFTEGFGEAAFTRVYLTAGEHTFWAVVENGGIPGAEGPCTYAMSLWSIDLADNLIAQILQTDSTWKVESFPSTPPGFTITKIVRITLDEAQNRGACQFIGPGDYTDSVDSAGTTLTETYDVSTKTNTPLGSFYLREMGETYADFRVMFNEVDGGTLLDVWIKGDRGDDTAVELERGVNIGYLTRNKAPTLATAFAVTWHEGYRYVNTTPVSGHPIKEAPLSLGAARTTVEVDRVAGGQLAQFGRIRGKYTVSHLTNPDTPDAEYPGLAYWTGDRVTIPTDTAMTPSLIRVIAMTWEFVDGQLKFTPELGDLVLPVDTRTPLAVRRLAPASLGGQSRVAQPVGLPPLVAESYPAV